MPKLERVVDAVLDRCGWRGPSTHRGNARCASIASTSLRSLTSLVLSTTPPIAGSSKRRAAMLSTWRELPSRWRICHSIGSPVSSPTSSRSEPAHDARVDGWTSSCSGRSTDPREISKTGARGPATHTDGAGGVDHHHGIARVLHERTDRSSLARRLATSRERAGSRANHKMIPISPSPPTSRCPAQQLARQAAARLGGAASLVRWRQRATVASRRQECCRLVGASRARSVAFRSVGWRAQTR